MNVRKYAEIYVEEDEFERLKIIDNFIAKDDEAITFKEIKAIVSMLKDIYVTMLTKNPWK